MKTLHFPYLAAAMGAFLLLVVVSGSRQDPQGATLLPLLTLLVVNEFAFFVTAIGGFIGVKNILAGGRNLRYSIVTALCLVLAMVFVWQGIQIWPW